MTTKSQYTESLQYAMLDNELLKWWNSQNTSFSELRELILKREVFVRKQALEEAVNQLSCVSGASDYRRFASKIKELLK